MFFLLVLNLGMDGGMDGLLGVAGMIITIMDHSRKFPAFRTSKIFGAQMATGRFSSFFVMGQEKKTNTGRDILGSYCIP